MSKNARSVVAVGSKYHSGVRDNKEITLMLHTSSFDVGLGEFVNNRHEVTIKEKVFKEFTGKVRNAFYEHINKRENGLDKPYEYLAFEAWRGGFIWVSKGDGYYGDYSVVFRMNKGTKQDRKTVLFNAIKKVCWELIDLIEFADMDLFKVYIESGHIVVDIKKSYIPEIHIISTCQNEKRK